MDLKEIVKATGGKPLDFKNTQIKGVSIDSRTIKKGELFIAIKGEHYDGHDFVGEAFKKGALAAVVSHQVTRSPRHKYKVKSIILVGDTIKALGDIAHYHRMKFNSDIIAITGSTGKTSVKEIIAYILSRKYNVLKTEGTRNNLIGLPLTLLKLDGRHQISVLEIGANHLGEIKRLSEITKPTLGVITNIGYSHLEYLRDIRAVFKAKSELLNFLNRKHSVLLNKDDKLLSNVKTKCKKIYFGIDNGCEFQATDIEKIGNDMGFRVRNVYFRIPLFGRHNIYNALIGIVIGQIFDINLNSIAQYLKNFKNPFHNRLGLYKNNYLNILDDTYNSNPLSFDKAIEVLSDLATKGRKIIVSSDMLELGEKSKYFHERLGKNIARSGIDFLITLGPMSKHISDGALKYGMRNKNVMYFVDRRDLMDILPKTLRKNDTILVKGSRATRMEEIVEKIKKIRN